MLLETKIVLSSYHRVMQSSPEPRAFIVESDIITLTRDHPRAEAMLCVENVIRAVGTREELRAFAPSAEIMDLRGNVLTPGLTDAHIHLVGYGFTLSNVQLDGTRSVREAVQRVRDRVERTPPGTWIQGYGFDRSLWGLEAYPSAAWLDEVSPDHPVVMGSRDGHSVWVNSRALQIAGIHAGTPDPDGGVIVRDDHGSPTGTLLENAMHLVRRAIPNPPFETVVDAARAGAQDMAARGFTAVHTMALEPPEHLRAVLELEARGELPLRVWACVPHAELEGIAASGLRGNLGERVKIAGIKFFADGALGSRTAWMEDDYVGHPGDRGVMVDSPQTILERGRWALELGFCPVVHAIGDRANHEVLNVLEELKPLADAKGIRLRLEHAQHLHLSDIPRFGQLGIVASVQPIHAPGDVINIERLLGPERAANTYAFRRLLETGAILALGSDAAVATPDPILGFQAAVERQDLNGTPWHKDQALTRQETLAGYTIGAAMAAGWEGWYGRIAPGYAADFTVWDGDPTLKAANPTQALRL
jgi:predicted amidohydrolase YtcJ